MPLTVCLLIRIIVLPSCLVFQALIFTLVYGIVFYPFFACLTTDYKFVGSVLGFLYAVIMLDLLSNESILIEY